MGLSFEQALGKNSHYSLLSALLYSTQTLTAPELEIDAATLEIPLQGKYSMLLKFRVRPYLYGAMIIPFTLKDNSNGTGIPTYSTSNTKEPEKDDQVTLTYSIPSRVIHLLPPGFVLSEVLA